MYSFDTKKLDLYVLCVAYSARVDPLHVMPAIFPLHLATKFPCSELAHFNEHIRHCILETDIYESPGSNQTSCMFNPHQEDSIPVQGLAWVDSSSVAGHASGRGEVTECGMQGRMM